MTQVMVIYRGTSADRFDREYYVKKHLPLAREALAATGLVAIDAFYPQGDGAGLVAIAVLSFKDEASIAQSFGSPAMGAVVADVPKFTDLKPTRNRAVPL